MSSREAPPWVESPFGKAKLHDNPLFKSSPADNLTREDFKENCGDRGDNYNSNSGPGKVSKVVKSSTLTKTSSKRVLGERNSPSSPQQRPEKRDSINSYSSFEEPPKSIRALSYPSIDLFGSSSSSSSSSGCSSEEETSPASRFQVCLSPVRAVSPILSEISSEDAEYDPKANLLTSRPKFLRYRPDWRLEFLNSLELAEGESLLEAIESRKQQQEEEEEEEEEERDDGKGITEVLQPDIDGETLGEAEETETGVDAEEKPSESVEVNPSSSSSSLTIRAVLKMMLFGALAGFVLLMVMDCFGMLPFDGFFSEIGLLKRPALKPGESFRSGITGFDPREGWEWHPEYDLVEGFGNQTVFELFSTDSEELDALLMAIMYGSDEDVQHKYLELMEYEREFDYLDEEEELFGELKHLESSEEMTPVEAAQEAVSEGVSSQEAHPEKQEEDLENTMIINQSGDEEASIDEELPVFPIDPVKLHQDLTSLKNLVASGELLAAPPFHLALLVTLVALGVTGAGYFFSRSWSTLKETSSTPVLTTRSKGVKPKTSEDLVISPECLKQSPFGSFTAYKRTVVNEGSKDEHIKLTPVRRSSRIQSQHRVEQTPPVKRRILLTPP